MLVAQRHAEHRVGVECPLWPVCLHCAVQGLCWEQEMSSPPDECSLCCYTPPSGSPHHSLSASVPGVVWTRTASLPGCSPRMVSCRNPLRVPLGTPSCWSSGHPWHLLCCTLHRGLEWSLIAVFPVDNTNKPKASDNAETTQRTTEDISH